MKWTVVVVAMFLAGCAQSSAPPLEGPPEVEEDVEPAAPPSWSEMDSAFIRPGLGGEAYGERNGEGFGVGFSFGFLFSSPDNGTIYASTVAHALHLAPGYELPLGTNVSVDGTVVGRFVYDGWADDSDVNDYSRDFALIELNDAGRAMAHPAMMAWQGPTGVASPEDVYPAWRLFTHGATSQEANEGRLVDRAATPWLTVHFDNPVQPGDSGSPILAPDGGALGLAVARVGVEEPTSQAEKVALVVPLLPNIDRATAAGHDLQILTWDFEAPMLPV